MSTLSDEKKKLLTRLQEAARAYDYELGLGEGLSGEDYVLLNNYMDFINGKLDEWENEITEIKE